MNAAPNNDDHQHVADIDEALPQEKRDAVAAYMAVKCKQAPVSKHARAERRQCQGWRASNSKTVYASMAIQTSEEKQGDWGKHV